jgi:hypothetical protein
MNFADNMIKIIPQTIVSHTFGKTIRYTLQNPRIAIPLVTSIVMIVALVCFWLLKRYSTWQFPSNKLKGSQ